MCVVVMWRFAQRPPSRMPDSADYQAFAFFAGLQVTEVMGSV